MRNLDKVNYIMTEKVDLKEHTVEEELQYMHKENRQLFSLFRNSKNPILPNQIDTFSVQTELNVFSVLR